MCWSDLGELFCECDCCSCLEQERRWIMCPIGWTIAFGLFLMTVLLPLSLKRVDFDETAMSFDAVSREWGAEVLREGLHDVGPAGELIIFKRTQRQGQFLTTALTQDGLHVFLTIDVLYSIQPSKLKEIINDYFDQPTHDGYIMSMAHTVVMDVIADFTARSFFLQRQEVQKQMEDLLKQRFLQGSAFSIVEAVQLSNVDFTHAVATALEQSTIVEQDIENAKAERATAVNLAGNRRTLASDNAELTLKLAERDVRVRNIQAVTDAMATNASLILRTDAFVNISNAFARGSDFFTHQYLKNLLLRENEGRTIVGLD